MAKKKTKSAGLSAFLDTVVAMRGVFVGVLIAGVIVGGGGYGFYMVRQYVERTLAYPPAQPTVVMKNRPAWMSDSLARGITASVQPRGACSAMDHQLLKNVAEVLEHNPWVREVRQVRRLFTDAPGDTIEIDCEYRVPLALVPYRGEYILVDSEGYKLPERFSGKDNPRIMFGADGRVNLRIVEGVAAMPPLLDGQKWGGEDLQAGLDLVKYLYGKPYAEDVYRVNVANYHGRKSANEAQLVLVTKYNSEVRWGAPIRGPINFEVPPERKLDYLATTYRHFGRVDGNFPWIDLRFDEIRRPESGPLVSAGGNPSRRIDN